METLENADAALQSAMQGDYDVMRVDPLQAAVEQHRANASPGVVAHAEAVLATWSRTRESNNTLQAAPADQDELRKAVEQNGIYGCREFVEEATARLQVLETSDMALQQAVDSSIIKHLRITVAEHHDRASPKIASVAKAKLLQLEEAADTGLRAELAAAKEASTLRELRIKYADRATESVLELASSAFLTMESADTVLAAAMEGEYDPDNIDSMRESLEKHRSLASLSIVADADSKISTWIATRNSNEALRAAPNDAPEIRRRIKEHSSNALHEVVEEAQARLERLATADDALVEAMKTSICAMRKAIPDHQEHATPEVVAQATSMLAQLEKDADTALRAGCAQAKEQSVLRGLHQKYQDRATESALDAVEARLKEVTEADKAIQDAIHSCIEREPKDLRSPISRLQKTITANRSKASPSIVSSTELALVEKLQQMNADANRALAMAPADYDELYDTIKANRDYGSPEVLAVTVCTLHVLKAVAELQSAVDAVKATAAATGVAALRVSR